MEQKLELGGRLNAVAELIPPGARLADVGTDHAYLPVWLLQRGRIPWAVASDIRPGPLARARSTAQRFHCLDRMDFRLCNGLSGIRREEADAVAIAGMGGETIAGILATCPWVREEGVALILQPMSTQAVLRRFLWRSGFRLEREVLAREGKGLYTIILARFGNETPLTLAEEWAGRQAPGVEAPLRQEYLRALTARTARALEGLERGKEGEASSRVQEMRQLLRELEEMEREWKQWQR